jgi:hypothetical protein
MPEAAARERRHWTRHTRRMGIASGTAMLAVGILYLATIALWLVVEATPLEPIGDPFLAVMEGLTIVSALALLGLVTAIWGYAERAYRVHGLLTLTLGALAAALTMAVHFVQLTAIRQLWRAGQLPDYRLVWPSTTLAVEYFAWDVLVGGTMILASFALAGEPGSAPARRTMLIGGALCLLGLVGPATGRMIPQNIAVAGYAVFLPVACALSARIFHSAPPSSDGSA